MLRDQNNVVVFDYKGLMRHIPGIRMMMLKLSAECFPDMAVSNHLDSFVTCGWLILNSFLPFKSLLASFLLPSSLHSFLDSHSSWHAYLTSSDVKKWPIPYLLSCRTGLAHRDRQDKWQVRSLVSHSGSDSDSDRSVEQVAGYSDITSSWRLLTNGISFSTLLADSLSISLLVCQCHHHLHLCRQTHATVISRSHRMNFSLSSHHIAVAGLVTRSTCARTLYQICKFSPVN